jgi:hypothetical protein
MDWTVRIRTLGACLFMASVYYRSTEEISCQRCFHVDINQILSIFYGNILLLRGLGFAT